MIAAADAHALELSGVDQSTISVAEIAAGGLFAALQVQHCTGNTAQISVEAPVQAGMAIATGTGYTSAQTEHRPIPAGFLCSDVRVCQLLGG